MRQAADIEIQEIVKTSPDVSHDPNLVKKCAEFITLPQIKKASVATYTNRHYVDSEKILKDIFYGKIGESGVHVHYKTTPPDFEGYEVGKKSYGPDLMLGERWVHVKSVSTRSAQLVNAVSWTFQKDDAIFRRQNSDDLLALVLVTANTSFIAAMVPLFPALEYVEDLVNKNKTKKALYWKTLVKNLEQLHVV